MTEAALEGHRALVRSSAAVWKSHLDQQSAAWATAMRPWGTNSSPSRLGEPYREVDAFVIATLFTEVAREPFARLYKSSLRRHPRREMNRAWGPRTGMAGESQTDPETCASVSP